MGLGFLTVTRIIILGGLLEQGLEKKTKDGGLTIVCFMNH
jgi:hypothetical protein